MNENANGGNSSLPESSQSQRDKIKLAYELKQHGYPVAEIAEKLGCCQKTVYNYLNKYRQEYLDELEASKALDIVIENLTEIRDLKDLCLRLACQIAEEEHLDPVTGITTPKKGSFRDKAEVLRLVRDFIRMEIDLKTQVGLLPKTPEKIYESIGDHRAKQETHENPVTREDLQRKALDLFQNQGWL